MALINLRNALMTGKRLPYDAELEWLQAVGTSTYIDTGVYPNATTECKVAVEFAGANRDYPAPLGSVDGTTRYTIRYGAQYAFFQCSAGNGVAFAGKNNGPNSVNIGYTRVFEIKNGKSYVDGAFTSDLYNRVLNTDDFPYPLFLFGANNQGANQNNGTNMRIRYCTITKNGVLVRDFIPVRVGTTGAIYDKRGVGGMNGDGTARNDGMYFNRGTGDFGYGNDLKYPIPAA